MLDFDVRVSNKSISSDFTVRSVFEPRESECAPRRRNMYSETAEPGGLGAPRAAVSLALGCRLSVSDHCMDDCPITVWYRGSATMLKHHPPGRVNACEKPSRPPKDTSARAREGARRSSNSVTVSAECVGSLNGRLTHHRVVRGQRFNAQTSPSGPLTRSHELRLCDRCLHPQGAPRCAYRFGKGLGHVVWSQL